MREECEKVFHLCWSLSASQEERGEGLVTNIFSAENPAGIETETINL